MVFGRHRGPGGGDDPAQAARRPLDRDEGEYAYFGQLLLEGVPPYAGAYNLKVPGIYGAYA